MGGYIIAFLRLLGLQAAFDSTMAAPEFVSLKIDTRIVALLKNGTFWALLKTIVTSCFGMLRLLRLADTKAPAMDKLLFYVHQVDELTAKHSMTLEAFDNLSNEGIDMLDDIMIAILSSPAEAMRRDGDKWKHMKDTLPDENDDDDEVEDPPPDDAPLTMPATPPKLGTWLLKCWKHRRGKLVHPFAVAAWMLSPAEHVREDVKKVL